MKLFCLLPLLGAAVIALDGCSQAPADRADAATLSENNGIDVTAGHLMVTDNGGNDHILAAASRNAGSKRVDIKF